MATGTPHPQDLADRTVVVIGASSGIGFATARQVRRHGGRVVMAGRDPRRLGRAAEEVGAERSVPLDAADTGRLREFFGALPGPVDHVVSTAGSPFYATLDDLDVDEARAHVGERLALTLGVAKYGGAVVRDAGTLVFVGGTGGRRPGIGTSVTAALTAALPALTSSLAVELAPVRVNLVAPGFVDTPLSASLLGDRLEERRERLRATLPIRRVVGPDDVAAVILHLMVNEAVTGATYDVDGGQQLVPP